MGVQAKPSGSGEFQYLDNYYGSDEAAFRRALHLPFSGTTEYGSAAYIDGVWWFSSAASLRPNTLGMDVNNTEGK